MDLFFTSVILHLFSQSVLILHTLLIHIEFFLVKFNFRARCLSIKPTILIQINLTKVIKIENFFQRNLIFSET